MEQRRGKLIMYHNPKSRVTLEDFLDGDGYTFPYGQKVITGGFEERIREYLIDTDCSPDNMAAVIGCSISQIECLLDDRDIVAIPIESAYCLSVLLRRPIVCCFPDEEV